MKRYLLVALLIFAACKNESPGAMEVAATATSPSSTPVKAPQIQRMIIRNATMSVIVRDAAGALDKILSLAESNGGYIADSKRWKSGEDVRATATLRVPAARLFPVLAAIRGMAVRVETENVSSDDVSQEYTDLGAQQRNLEATETELREMLKTIRDRTQRAADVLEIYAEVARVRGEIDRIEGRMRYLSQMTALATITVELVPDVVVKSVVEPGWQPLVTIKAATRALVNALEAMTDIAIWFLIYLFPLGLMFVLVVLLIRAIVIRLHPQRAA